MNSTGAQAAHEFAPDGSLEAVPAPFKILVVDGHGFFTPAVEEAMQSGSQQLLKAASADEAVAITAQFQPDLILFDNEVEGVSGRDVLVELLIEQPSSAVVILANHPRTSDAVTAMRQGAFDYLESPLDLRKLQLIVEIQKAIF